MFFHFVTPRAAANVRSCRAQTKATEEKLQITDLDAILGELFKNYTSEMCKMADFYSLRFS
jgi:hypothetical protein